MTETELKSSVRLMCGNPDETKELTDTNIVAISAWILNIIGERITVRRVRYITLLATQPEGGYDVHASCTRVKSVLTSGEIDDTNLLNPGSDYQVAAGTDASDYYNWPSLWTIKMQRSWRGRSRFKWTFDAVNKKLRIDPHASSNAGDKYYYLSIEHSHWTLDDLPSEFDDLLITGVSWKALEAVALVRSPLGGVHREGGFVTYPATELKRFVDQKRDEFFTDLNLKAKIYSR